MVLGVGKSVELASSLLVKSRPDIVLTVDIFLKGDLTGIDLANGTESKKYTLYLFICKLKRRDTGIGYCYQALWISDKTIS